MKIKIISILLSIGFLTTTIIKAPPIQIIHDITIKTKADLDTFNLYLTELAKKAGIVLNGEKRERERNQNPEYRAQKIEEKIKKLKEFCQTHTEVTMFFEKNLNRYAALAPYCLAIDQDCVLLWNEENSRYHKHFFNYFAKLLGQLKIDEHQKKILITYAQNMNYDTFFKLEKEIEKIQKKQKLDENILSQLYQLYIEYFMNQEWLSIAAKIAKKQQWFIDQYIKIDEINSQLRAAAKDKNIVECQKLLTMMLDHACDFMIQEYELFPLVKEIFIKARLSETRKEILNLPFYDFVKKENQTFSLQEFQASFEPIIHNCFNKFFDHFEK